MPDISQGSHSRAAGRDYNEYHNLHPIKNYFIFEYSHEEMIKTIILFCVGMLILLYIQPYPLSTFNRVFIDMAILGIIYFIFVQKGKVFKTIYFYKDNNYFTIDGVQYFWEKTKTKRENENSNMFQINLENYIFLNKQGVDDFIKYYTDFKDRNFEIELVKSCLLNATPDQLRDISKILEIEEYV